MWYVYILRCTDGNLYTGSTTDITRRLKEHHSGRGGAYTRTHLPVKLIYQESLSTRANALKREAQIKRWRRKDKIALVNRGKE